MYHHMHRLYIIYSFFIFFYRENLVSRGFCAAFVTDISNYNFVNMT